jgi:alkanesulfonate monooxygenase SsuD/methylene tetrahydromethanopterin reductase-like flavin-dependent oxidoreductase (luciferase family)
VSVVNPILAARQCATLDHVSNGRFALNVVAGWNLPELEMFGREIKAHQERYDEAQEWVQLLKRLWSEDAPFDHYGENFALKQAISLPHPLQPNGPPIMSAGGSPRGMHFAARNADLAFTVLPSEDPDDIAARVAAYRNLARTEYKRDIQVWTFATVIQRDSLADAEAYEHHFAVEHGDEAVVDAFIRLNSINSKAMPLEKLQQMRMRLKGGGGFPLKGCATQIAEHLAMLSNAGIDGLLLVWPEPYGPAIRKFGDSVLPLLEQMGLRCPFSRQSDDG